MLWSIVPVEVGKELIGAKAEARWQTGDGLVPRTAAGKELASALSEE
jgi:hypothetical protein